MSEPEGAVVVAAYRLIALGARQIAVRPSEEQLPRYSDEMEAQLERDRAAYGAAFVSLGRNPIRVDPQVVRYVDGGFRAHEAFATPPPDEPQKLPWDPPIRGPRALVVVEQRQGWPLDNLDRDGCKHDIHGGEEALLFEAGHVIPCAKCGASIVYVATVARALRGHGLTVDDGAWETDEFDAVDPEEGAHG